ncbi:MAG: HK97 gp10 family phage protein [Planctomycetota bacterium]|jgi:hypothetical protein
MAEVEWFGNRVLKAVKDIVEINEEDSARRVAKDARKNCPVGKWERSGGGIKSWKARNPGSLKKSIEVHKSKYKDGGHIVSAGGYDVYYASFVELGVPAKGIPKKAFLRGAAKKEERRFRSMLKGLLS